MRLQPLIAAAHTHHAAAGGAGLRDPLRRRLCAAPLPPRCGRGGGGPSLLEARRTSCERPSSPPLSHPWASWGWHGWRRAGSGLAPGARSALWGSGRAAQGLSSTYAEAEARAPTSAGIGQPELFRARPPLCSLPRLGLRAAGGRGRGNSGGVSRVSNDESRVWSNRVYIALAQHTPLSRVSAYRTQRSSIFITRVRTPLCHLFLSLSLLEKCKNTLYINCTNSSIYPSYAYNASKPCRSVASNPPAVRPMKTNRERRAASSAGGICSGGTRSSSTCEPGRYVCMLHAHAHA